MQMWRFPSNDYGENKGINDSGVAMFRGTPLKSLAREICQNSLDAAVDDKIVVEFNKFVVPSESIPGKDDLADSFSRCIEFWSSQKAKATKDFFTCAINEISKDDVSILRISDFNTTGLTGSRELINTDWTNLTKSSGASDKRGTAGGSFGIGKYAPFACSYFSTVFYSTYDINEEKACQGVARLVTFTRQDSQNTQGTGYYGEEKNTPVYEELHLDPTFCRSEKQYGTDIFIIGYKYDSDDWQKELIISVLDGFLGAIFNEKLEVKIGDITINKDCLGDIIDEYRDDLTGYTSLYYSVLTSAETVWYTDNFLGLGEIRLGILIGEHESSNKISMIRKTGMKIMDKDRLPGHVPYMGVMFINGDDINQRLRLIENPEHTRWEPERSNNPTKERELLRALNEYIKDRIEELINTGEDDALDAAGVGKYLPDESDDNSEKAYEETVSDKVVDVEVKTSVPKSTSASNEEGSDDSDSDDTETGAIEGEGDVDHWPHPGGTTDNPSSRPPEHGKPFDGGLQKVPTKKTIKSDKVVCLCVDKPKGKYMLKLSPDSDGKDGVIEVYLSAETQKYPAPLKSVSIIGGQAEFSENKIKGVVFEKGKELRLSIEIDFHDYCSMEVLMYATA